ncbi:WD domain protein [Kalaharituber pfeilii]|nr:WD domain protein [Kalaharituber pfeilii]
MIKVWDAKDPEHPNVHTFDGAHRLGIHHVAVNSYGDGSVAATVGFEGELKLWDLVAFKKTAQIDTADSWAVSLTPKGNRCISTTHDGRIVTRDTRDLKKIVSEYTTKGSFGICADISADGKLTASGHENGGIYVFSNESGRIIHSLSGLVKPIRAVAFSPGGRLLAAAGESQVIALYDAASGEQVAIFSGHSGWIFSLSWSETGEYLLSGSFDGKAKVWSIEQKTCVATHSESDQGLYAIRWLPRVGMNEGFVTAGINSAIAFYREAMGG